ncbi:MAG: hypothetical protein UX39_C0013G0011 [Candidatus Magasanikbacteria bacterium GW2011_GWA2_46_17]|uniref:Uncharacterized protein n=1 Tax=Candidatus Magasanikbacteria bacterium GW2011_GWA2_46_17 TaxID=1619042 RepID=A0A0G1NZH1_9BACT|nr:MAG: hypothetical protein UX39_C0013G0011 [Candidatus Magasanikbacteria bacterium GW2011_GWA2_46_17]
MDNVLHLHEFFVEGGQPEKSHVLLTITEPATPEERAKGYFFAVCEIIDAETSSISKLQNVVDEIENSYYEVPEEEGKSSLETVLEKINQRAFALTAKHDSIHCVVGVLRPPEILFSFYGRPTILLLYKNKQGEFKQMDLVAQNESDSDAADSRQLFSQIVQGKIGAGDYFFMSTPQVSEYFNHDRLQKIITTRPPRQSAEHVQRVLSELKNDISFGGVIINYTPQTDARDQRKIHRPNPGESARSLVRLLSTEQRTASILSSSLLPRLQRSFAENQSTPRSASTQTYLKTEDEENARPAARIASQHLRVRQNSAAAKPLSATPWQTYLKSFFKISWFAFRYAARALLWICVGLIQFLSGVARSAVLLFIVMINYRNRRAAILLEWRRSRQSFAENIRRLPLLTKLLVVISVALAIAVTGSGIYIKLKQQRSEAESRYASALQLIREKKDAAESALIYNDTTLAERELRTAQNTLAALPCKADEARLTCDQLRSELDVFWNRIRKISIVPASALTDWKTDAPKLSFDEIIKIQNKIIGFSANTTSLFVYDTLTKKVKRVETNVNSSGFTAGAVPKESDYALFIYNGKRLAKYNPVDDSLKEIDIDYPSLDAEIADIVIYNRKLYSLDKKNNQIYKHEPTRTGFERGKPWVRDNTVNLQNSVSFAIEGDIFVINSQGAVIKLSKGSVESFVVSGLDPAMTSPAEIWSYTDLNYIYILDPGNKRLIIFEKNGRLKSQITASEFNNPISMVIDEPNGTGYVLDGGTLYQIPLK